MPRGDVKIEFPPPSGGFLSNQTPWLQPLASLSDGSNVVVRNGKLYIRPGFRQLNAFGFGERVMGGFFYQLPDGTKKLVAGGLTKRKQFLGGSGWADITGTAWAGNTESQAIFVAFPSGNFIYLIGTNGRDQLTIWNGTDATDSDLAGGAPSAVKDICVSANRVIYANLTLGGIQYPYALMWSNSNDPFTTDPLSLTQLAAGTGPIIAVCSLGVNAFAIYADHGQYLASAQGDVAPFRIDFRSSQPGPASPAAIVPAGEGPHYYMGWDGNFYRFDGVSCSPIGNTVRAAVQNSLDPNYRALAHGAFDAINREIHWFWQPLGSSSVSAGITYRLDEGTFSPIHSFNRHLTASWAGQNISALTWLDLTGTWVTLGATYPTWLSMGGTNIPMVFLGEENGQTYAYGQGSTDDGDAIAATWTYPLHALTGDGNLIKVDCVESYFKQLASSMGVNFFLGTANFPGGDVTWQAAQALDVSLDDIPTATYIDTQGRFGSIKYEISEANQGIEYHGALLYAYGRKAPA